MNESVTIDDFRIDLSQVGGTLLNVPWEQSGEYFALASVGALVPGWSLIFPRKRSLSFAATLANADLQSFVKRVRDVVSRSYGSAWVFEHGSAASGSASGCGVDYAHLHVAPLDFDLCSASRHFDQSLDWIEMEVGELERVTAGREYLLVSSRAHGAEIESIHVAFPSVPTSQFFRRVIASALGRPSEFDYKAHLQIQTALTGREVLSRVSAEQRAGIQ